MKTFAASAALLGALLTVLGEAAYVRVYPDQISTNVEIALAATHAPVRAVDPSAVVEQYCVRCHNERRMTGNLTLEGFETESAHEMAEIAEKMILKLRAGMMPPPGAMRPEGDSLQALAEMLEAVIDAAAAADPNPGTRRFQRLNRPEYERVIRDLLDLEIDAGRWLTADTYLGNFDNLSAAQGLSTTLLESYLRAATEVSRLAVGNSDALSSSTKYSNAIEVSQHAWDHIEGTPFGTRGGMVVTHDFPADGEYFVSIETLFGAGSSSDQ
jgi:cytochrome c5